jgi:DNA-binding MarR family transcriptional regulator
MTDTSPPQLLFEFFNEVGIIEQLSRSQFERVMPKGMSLAGFSLLNHFVRLDKVNESPARLAAAFQVTKGAMTNTLQRLEALGLIAIVQDPQDGRAKLVSITPAGRDMRDTCLSNLAPKLRQIAAVVDIDDLAVALPRLTAIREILDASR